MTSLAFSRPLNKVTSMLPSSSYRWSTTSLRESWRLQRLANEETRPDAAGHCSWFMRRMSGLSTWRKLGTGTAAATSLPPRPKPCGKFSCRTPAAEAVASTAAACARVDVDDLEIAAPERSEELPGGSSDALTQLAVVDSQAAELVKLRYFAGCTIPQAAEILGVSPRKADFVWVYARTWLFQKLQGEDETTTPLTLDKPSKS